MIDVRIPDVTLRHHAGIGQWIAECRNLGLCVENPSRVGALLDLFGAVVDLERRHDIRFHGLGDRIAELAELA